MDSSNLEHQVLENDHTYTTVGDMQQQMIVASDNPAYGKGLKHSRPPAQHCNYHVRQTIELSQEQEMVTRGPQAHGAVQFKKAARAK